MAKQISARQLVAAGGLALAVAIAPSVGYFAGATTARDYRTIANPSTCTVSRSGSSSSLVCVPGIVPSVSGVGAPSQQDLTAKNAQRSHAGG
jgi:hypothetical protein